MHDCANARALTPVTSVRHALPLVSTADAYLHGAGCDSCGTTADIDCRPSDAPNDMKTEIWEKIRDHPCYSEEAHRHYARMHVAVAPACNIQCNYCNRKFDCSNESRPGVVSEKLTPHQAVKKVMAVASRIPQMTVVGIAGPGDSLADPKKTFDTFRMLRERAPDMKLCLSTNGLALPDYVDEICHYGIDHVTITINMIDPSVGERIYPWIFWDHRRIAGAQAARILHERQMLGLEMLSARGVLTKINSVLIPGINDEHLIEVNREVKRRGAFLHNIMPLISDAAHGTHFGTLDQREPTVRELKTVQDACMAGANVMRHCRQCRADAVGLLGEDRGEEFALDRIEHMEVAYDVDFRRKYQRGVEVERQAQREMKRKALTLAHADLAVSDVAALIAVATKGGGRVNAHFGHVSEFQIFQVSADQVLFVGHRRVGAYCHGGYGDDDGLAMLLRAIEDCHAVLVAKIGVCPRQSLSEAGIELVDMYAHESVEQAALAWFTDYCRRLRTGAIVHANRGNAATRQNGLTNAAAAPSLKRQAAQ
ncbi:nitrogenase cofactor biosynthesis protein NifB [Paraburkholderia phenoliruptrix]|uniref:FeMo cofactor biosynthesis protein NifB n=1 Tax=Paraburkholderia phenoliruptrix TaxID=252970 RepID=A0ABV3WL67_9BURK